MAMPRMRARVVWTLWVTMETLAPTMRFSSVDLPAFGSPIRATRPQRVGASVMGFLQEREERLGGLLLGGAFRGRAAAGGVTVREAGLDGEDRRVVRAFAVEIGVVGRGHAAGLRPFLERGLGVGGLGAGAGDAVAPDGAG